MTTRAEEIAGPYMVKKLGSPEGEYWYAVVGADGRRVMSLAMHEPRADLMAYALNAAYKQGQQDRWIPDGWALVPLVATPEMLLNAGFPASSTGDSTTGQNTWEWFVKSAPSPPNPEQR